MMPDEKRTKVLIIDDNEVDRYTYRRYLEQASSEYEVHEAEDGRTGLMLAETVDPDCVLLDLRLHNQSGYEVLRELVGDDAPPKRPVIMLTVLAWDALQQGARSLGATGYLVKGRTDAAALDKAIRQAIGTNEKRAA